MHRHDADEIAALGRKRTRRLFRRGDVSRKRGRDRRRTARPVLLDGLDNANRLEDIARHRLSLGTEELKSRKPARFLNGFRHDCRNGLSTRTQGEVFHDSHSVSKVRRDLSIPAFEQSGHLGEPNVYPSPTRHFPLFVEACRKRDEIVCRQNEHIA